MRRWWLLAAGALLAVPLVCFSAARNRGTAQRAERIGAGERSTEALHVPELRTEASERSAVSPHEPVARPPLPADAAARLPTLVVRLLDPLGEPLTGFDVAVASSPVEPDELAFAERRLPTDADGRARFEGVPEGTRLVVALRGQDLYERFARVRDGELVGDGTPASEALLVTAGETRALELRLGTRLRLRGVVLEEGIGPVPDVVVNASSHPRAGGAASGTRTREDGSFELELLSHAPLATLDVRAERRPNGGMFQAKALTHRADYRVALEGQTTGEVSVTLVLAPTLALTGRVVEADGRAAEGRIRALRPEDGLAPLFDGSTNVVGGEFRIRGLAAGEYELEMLADHRRGRSVPLGVFAAGAEDLLLELPPEKKAHVTFEVSTAAGFSSAPAVLRAQLVEPLRPIEATLAREVVLDAPLGWPENALASLSSGASNFRSSSGDVSASLGTRETNPVVLELAAGPYCLGARGTDALGRGLFPAGTGLVRLEEGEYRVRLELVPATTLAGRVEGAQPQEELHVALALPDGRLVPLDGGRGWMRATNPLDARGGFRFELAPSGTFELRVGSEAELLDGRARLRQLVTLRADEPGRVTLTL